MLARNLANLTTSYPNRLKNNRNLRVKKSVAPQVTHISNYFRIATVEARQLVSRYRAAFGVERDGNMDL